MTCPNCGAQLLEGSTMCTNCGAPISDPYATPAYQPAPDYSQVAVPEKKKTGLIVGIIAGAVVLIAAVVLLCVFVLGGGKGKTDGKYVCSMYAALGMNVYMEVDGEDVSLVMEYDTDGDGVISSDERETEKGTIEFGKDTCTITIDGEAEECAYDKKEGTITIGADGFEMEFKKE